jgi:molecular chaperone GrpE
VEKEKKDQEEQVKKNNKAEGNDKNTDEKIEANKKVETLKIQLEETEDRLKRVAAEFDNYKKRSAKEKTELYNSIMADVVSNFLPVIDNLEKAVEVETKDEEYKKGIELVLKQFQDVLLTNGVQEIEAIGQTFDPEFHEAVSSVQDDTKGEKEIVQEYRKGYRIGNRVIRHSMVIVAN